jgi:hypothetical protein
MSASAHQTLFRGLPVASQNTGMNGRAVTSRFSPQFAAAQASDDRLIAEGLHACGLMTNQSYRQVPSFEHGTRLES